MNRRYRSLAFCLGLTLALLSALRLLCSARLLPAGALEICRRLPCVGRDCAPGEALADRGDAQDSDLPLAPKLLLKNPAAPQPWLQIGRRLWLENQPAKARYCVERAAALAPHSPPVLLEAASIFHAAGFRSEGFELMSRVLAVTREYDSVIFGFYRRSTDVAEVLDQGLPQEPAAASSYFLSLLDGRDWRGAQTAWDWLSRRGLCDATILRRYLRGLIEVGLYDEAAAVFASFLALREAPTGGGRIAHGGFEAESTGAPLDWIITPSPHAEARRDATAAARQGNWSLRIEFDGQANLEYRHVAQQAIVSPGSWKLRAWIRTQGITSDQGIGLRIFESRPSPKWQVWTETVTGDSGWKLVEAAVEVPAPIRLVRIEIVRRPSNKLDNKLAGVAWIDDVSLTPDAAPGGLRPVPRQGLPD